MLAQNQPVRFLLTSILPKGKGLVVMLKCYADESVNPDSNLMIIAGFVMTEDQFIALDDAVRVTRGSMPYFHMREQHHTTHPDVYQNLVALIKPNSVLFSFSASIYTDEHKALTRGKLNNQPVTHWVGKPYTYALGQAMNLVSETVGASKYRDEMIAYVFENGHANEGDANDFWGKLSQPSQRRLKAYYRYASHTFVDGKGPLGSVLQMCDILAWNKTKLHRDQSSNQELDRMLDVPHSWNHHDAAEMTMSAGAKLGHSAPRERCSAAE